VPEVVETLRGGQITFHGPGQLVIYPILDLKAVRSEKWPKGLSAKCFVNLLEEATIKTLETLGVKGIRTEHPGVWVSQQTKIAALGLHLRRNITSFGVGLNICTDLRYFKRIVACGLEGKGTTSVRQEQEHMRKYLKATSGERKQREEAMLRHYMKRMRRAEVSKRWVEEFSSLVWGNDVMIEKLVADEERWGSNLSTFLGEKGVQDTVNPD
jgi:lipoate-protein ligase B